MSNLNGLFRYSRRIWAIVLLALTMGAGSVAGQDLQSPSGFLGYELGSRFTPHHRVMDYVRHVEHTADAVKLIPYGRTYENRQLVLAVVASPENRDRIEDIRLNNLRLAGMDAARMDAGNGMSDGAEMSGAAGTKSAGTDGAVSSEPSLDDAPAIVWLSYNVHGNESVSTEAAMQTLYELADPANESTGAWLENTVVIIDPSINPDGRDRYVNWYNRTVGAFPDVEPDGVEHDEPWPGGRTNHYYFDLNRDWSWVTQRETRARLAQYNAWMPHVHVDFHEQGVNSPYYFAPAARPYHPVITDWQIEFQTTIGRNHARYFDANGWLYFTKQVFDLFYPGYGDTFPTYNGAIGMTYEQAGSGRAGLGVLTATGDTLTLADRIAHHHTTGLSTVEAASDNRKRVVDEFRAYFERAAGISDGDVKAYVIRSHQGEMHRVEALADHLETLGIRTATLAEDTRVEGYSYREGRSKKATAARGDLVVPAAQPKGVLTRVLMEPESNIPDSLTYDITAWSLPYAYDLDAYASLVSVPVEPNWKRADLEPRPEFERPYAWLVHWGGEPAVRLLADLLKSDVNVRFSERSIRIGEEFFAPGALVITRADNESMGGRLDAMMRDAAREHSVRVVQTESGFVDEGPDLGSGDVRYLEKPRVGIAFGSPVFSFSVGEVWHYFDQVAKYPTTRFDAGDLGRMDLDQYDVIVLPSGRYGSVLNGSSMDAFRDWIRAGGRVVALGTAVSFFAGKDGFSLSIAEDKKDEDPDTTEARPSDYAERDRDRLPEQNPGAIFRVQTDDGHPLAFGLREETFVLRRRSEAPELFKENGGWNVGVVSTNAVVSGHVGHEAKQKLTNTLSFGVENLGRGTVTYLLDEPLYRGFWYTGRQVFANAVFLVGR